MSTVTLGKTGIKANKNGFGALPIQRVPMDEAVKILRKALDNGVNFFDTAHVYSDSEEKIGTAFKGMSRTEYYIATKAMVSDTNGFWQQLEQSLTRMNTDYIDIYQFHNAHTIPNPGDGSGLYEAMLEAKKQGKIRYIGITSHRLPVATQAVLSGLYDTLQFPFSYLSSEKDIELVNACKEYDVGFIAMKALSGGLITNSAAAYAWMCRFDNVVPIWGIQRESELDEFISYTKNPPELTEELQNIIDFDRGELTGEFCRGCGYCEPSCPAGIQISTSARMSHLIRRSPSNNHLTAEAQARMRKIEDCIHCGNCKAHCPYSLDPPVMLEKNYKDYLELLAGKPM